MPPSWSTSRSWGAPASSSREAHSGTNTSAPDCSTLAIQTQVPTAVSVTLRDVLRGVPAGEPRGVALGVALGVARGVPPGVPPGVLVGVFLMYCTGVPVGVFRGEATFVVIVSIVRLRRRDGRIP